MNAEQARSATVRVRERAPAKVNLLLRVVGRRADGYHRLVSIMAELELADELEAVRLPDGRQGLVRVEVEGPQAARLSATGTALREQVFAGDLPQSSRPNLVARAALAMAERYKVQPTVQFTLTKRIPAASGLGGGSSDAAAAMRALARLWEIEVAPRELEQLAAGVGADVAFFVRGGVQLARGIGEELAPLTSRCQAWYVVAVPPCLLPTQEVYARWDARRGDAEAASVGETTEGERESRALQEAQAMAQALAQGDLEAVALGVANDLQEPALELCPPVAGLLEAMRRAGLMGVQVSGSGPAVFGLAASEQQARARAARLRGLLQQRRIAAELFVGRLAGMVQ